MPESEEDGHGLSSFLQQHGLSKLCGALASETLDTCLLVLDEGRPCFLKWVGRRGVKALNERQALANALRGRVTGRGLDGAVKGACRLGCRSAG